MSLSTLPSFSDVMLIFVLIIPGFVTFAIMKRIALNEQKIGDFESLVWSLSLSLLIYVLFGFLTGLQSFDVIYFKILDPFYVALIFGIGVSLGVISSFVYRVTVKRGIDYGDCWETSLKAAKDGSFIIVHTVDNKEYKGAYYMGGIGRSPREIVVKNPKIIIRDADYVLKDEIEVGKFMLFKNEDILRISFLNDLSM